MCPQITPPLLQYLGCLRLFKDDALAHAEGDVFASRQIVIGKKLHGTDARTAFIEKCSRGAEVIVMVIS